MRLAFQQILLKICKMSKSLYFLKLLYGKQTMTVAKRTLR